MASHGPVPKRSDQRRRTNAPATPITTAPAAELVPIPEPDPDWHPIAARWFTSLAKSGQCIYYQPSDWATAVLVAESMSRDLGPQVVGVTDSGEVVRDTIPLKGASLNAYRSVMSVLMVTEGDRRRSALELERANVSDPDAERAAGTVSDIRSRLTGS